MQRTQYHVAELGLLIGKCGEIFSRFGRAHLRTEFGLLAIAWLVAIGRVEAVGVFERMRRLLGGSAVPIADSQAGGDPEEDSPSHNTGTAIAEERHGEEREL